MAPELSAVIPAAGFSSRMGDLKALLPLGKTTVLGHCIQRLQDCGIEDVLVVTGHRGEEVKALALQAGARTIDNPDFASGMFSSIRAGFRGISSRSQGLLLLPVDIPLVRRPTLKRLIDAFADAPALLTYPLFDGRRGHPPLIAAELLAGLSAPENPEGGLRSLLTTIEAQQPQRVREVQVADANILFDMDTPEDYQAGCRRWKREGIPTSMECEAILRHFHPMPEKGLAHGRRVGEIAGALCAAVNRNSDLQFDTELCQVSGLLHDIAKGHAHHEQEGSRWLHALGFDRVAAIVAEHKDLHWTPERGISEKEMVYLADKLVRGSEVISVNQRFEEKLRLYRDDPEAVQAIRGRQDQARQVAVVMERAAGRPLADILSDIPAVCNP